MAIAVAAVAVGWRLGQLEFFDVDERLKDISAKGDDLERLNQIVDFEVFRADLERAVPGPMGRRADGAPDPAGEPFAFR